MKKLHKTSIIILFLITLFSITLTSWLNNDYSNANAVTKSYSKINVPGFTIQPGSRDNNYGGAVVIYKANKANAKGRFALITVHVSKCFNCTKLKRAEWQAKRNTFMMMLSSITKNDPNLVFDIEELRISGKNVITVYSESYVHKGPSRAAAYGLDLYYHNNKKQVKISVTSRAKSFSMAKSLQEMKENFSKQEMIEAASKIFRVYRSKL